MKLCDFLEFIVEFHSQVMKHWCFELLHIIVCAVHSFENKSLLCAVCAKHSKQLVTSISWLIICWKLWLMMLRRSQIPLKTHHKKGLAKQGSMDICKLKIKIQIIFCMCDRKTVSEKIIHVYNVFVCFFSEWIPLRLYVDSRSQRL